MSSSSGVTLSSPQDRQRSNTNSQGDRSIHGLEEGPKLRQICLTAFCGAVGLLSATGSYYFGLNDERDKHPLLLVIGSPIIFITDIAIIVSTTWSKHKA